VKDPLSRLLINFDDRAWIVTTFWFIFICFK